MAKLKERTRLRILGIGAVVFLGSAVFPAAADGGPYLGAYLFCIAVGLSCAAVWYWRLPSAGELRLEQMTNAVFVAFPLLLFGAVLISNYLVWEAQSYIRLNLEDPRLGTLLEARLILWQGIVIVALSLLAMFLGFRNRRELIEKEWLVLSRTRRRWHLVGAVLLLALTLFVIIGAARYRLKWRKLVETSRPFVTQQQ